MACFASTLGVIILSTFITLSAANKDTCDLYAAVGQTLTLPFDYKALASTDDLRWTHNSTIIFYRQPGRVSVGKPEDISATGSLHLKNLKSSSAGIYKADVLNNNGTFVKGWNHRLCMMEKVSKPQVNFVCDSKARIVTLTCQVAKPQGMVFTWTLDEKTLNSETRQTLSISLTQLKGENNFTCSVANKVSKEISNSVRLTCKEPAPPALSCFRPKAVMATLAGGACLILIQLIIIIVLCWCRRRNKTLMVLGDKGKVQRVPLKQYQQPSSPDYETMHPTEASPTPSPKPSPRAYDQAVPQDGPQAQESLQVSRAAKEQPSPVPKPRMKTP